MATVTEIPAVAEKRKQAKLKEIARHHKRKRPPISFAVLRIADLRRLYADRYGRMLPDDDAGRDAAFVMACHLAKRPDAERRIANWLELQAPWMRQDEA